MNEFDPELRGNGFIDRDGNNAVFHRKIESHTVSLLKESALRCPTVREALGSAAVWKRDVFLRADDFGTLQSSFIGIVGRSRVAQIADEIRQAFCATMKEIVSRVEPEGIVHDDPAAELASIALNSRSQGVDFLKAVERVGHEFEQDLADLK